MRVAYFDCLSGIAGDMTLAALVDLGLPLEDLQAAIDSLGLPSCRLVTDEVKRKGFRAVHLKVEHEPEHAHRHLHHIEAMIRQSALTAGQQDLAMRIFTRLGKAEAHVHGSTLQKVHFHEVGAVDSIADIVGVAVGLDWLGADRIVCSPIPTGHGTVEIAHGRVSIPAPATAELLKGIPLRSCDVEGELTTPTGAAIVATIADEFGQLPGLTLENIGWGAGTRDWKSQANVLRIMVGQQSEVLTDQIWVLETNLDDCSGEVIGYTTEKLFAMGALDVYCTPIQMKKNRPGVKITVLAPGELCHQVEHLLSHQTTTLGVRKWVVSRTKLDRWETTVETPWGQVQGKVARLEGGEEVFSPEYESLKEVAESSGEPLRKVDLMARQAFTGGE
jgi:uncharacterized protein (TIGR00299 family) protein